MRVAITGCNRGIGQAVSHALAREGASLLVHARRTDDLERVVDDVRSAGASKVVGVAGDLRDETLGARFAAAAFDDLGGLDAALLSASRVACGSAAAVPSSSCARGEKVSLCGGECASL